MTEIKHAYPVFLNLNGPSVLMVGGGTLAERRVRLLLESGALVTVVSPRASRVIRRLHGLGRLTYLERPYRRGDLDGHAMVILATDDDGVHRQVLDHRREANQALLVNDAMRPERGDFTTPALFREGSLSVAVSTGGVMPTLASAVAAEVGQLIGHTAGRILRRYRDWKGSVTDRKAFGPEAVRALRRAVDQRLVEAFRSGDISRVTAILDRAEKLAILPRGRLGQEAPDAPKEDPGRKGLGTVYLVGAGPGDPGLLTVKGRRLIQSAGAVVYDRLIDAELLELAPPWTALHPVGKAPGRHALSQDEIHELLKELASKHEVVVRLKGGDPFVFGRGGEEAEYLKAEGIPYAVVPGVSSAVAVPAFAGIPLTHREHASSFAVVTGHRARPGEETRPVHVPDADTLVYLMGLSNLPNIVEAMRAKGLSPDTPVTVVSLGTTVRQEVVTSSLGAIAEEVRLSGVMPPAVIVVGEVARLAGSLKWFSTGGAEAFPADEKALTEKLEEAESGEPLEVKKPIKAGA